jgi:hypothetical protein
MPQNKSYEDHNPRKSPITDFFIWLFIIGVAMPLSYGWVLVNAGWISNATLFAYCGALGVVIGLKAAINTVRRKREKAKKAVIPP